MSRRGKKMSKVTISPPANLQEQITQAFRRIRDTENGIRCVNEVIRANEENRDLQIGKLQQFQSRQTELDGNIMKQLETIRKTERLLDERSAQTVRQVQLIDDDVTHLVTKIKEQDERIRVLEKSTAVHENELAIIKETGNITSWIAIACLVYCLVELIWQI